MNLFLSHYNMLFNHYTSDKEKKDINVLETNILDRKILTLLGV